MGNARTSQRRRHDVLISPSSSFLSPIRPSASHPSSPLIPRDQSASPEHAKGFGHSFERIAVHRPDPGVIAGNAPERIASGETTNSSMSPLTSDRGSVAEQDQPIQTARAATSIAASSVSSAHTLQRAPAPAGSPDTRPLPANHRTDTKRSGWSLERMAITHNDPSPAQRYTTDISRTQEPSSQGEVLQQKPVEPAAPKKNSTGLPDHLKAGVEGLSGFSLDDVHVHYNSDRPAQVDALAYTQGSEIHVGPGQEQHLAHEAWHVVQQKQGRVQPTLQAKGVAINDDQGLEREADVMGYHSYAYGKARGGGIGNKTYQATSVDRADKAVSSMPAIQRVPDPWNPAANALEVTEANAQNARLAPPPHPIDIGPEQQPGPPPTTTGNQKHFDADMLKKVRTILNYLPAAHIIGNPALARVVMEHHTPENEGISAFGNNQLHIVVPFDASSWVYLSVSKWPLGDLATTLITNTAYTQPPHDNPNLSTKWHETFNRNVVGTGSITNKISMLGENFVDWLIKHETGHSVDEAIGFTANHHYRNPALGGWLIHDGTDTSAIAMRIGMYSALGLQPHMSALHEAFSIHTGTGFLILLANAIHDRDPNAFNVPNKKAARNAFERGGIQTPGGVSNPVPNGAWKAKYLEEVVLEGLESPWQKGGKGGKPLGNRTYQVEYQHSRWVSYDSAKYRDRNSNYQYSGPEEWFAETYAHYFSHSSLKFWQQASQQWGSKLNDAAARAWFRANLDPINTPGAPLITANILQPISGPEPAIPTQNQVNVPNLRERVGNSLKDLTVTVAKVGTSGLFRLLSTIFLLPLGALKYLAQVPLQSLWKKIVSFF